MNPRALAILLCAAVVGCTQLQPFGAVPNQAEGPKHDPRHRIAVCYDPLWSDAAKVAATAQAECGAAATPEKVDMDYGLQKCPMLLPAHATYVCVPQK